MSRIRNEAHKFLDAYERMNNIFEQRFGYSLYFIGGTLLGFIREHDFLANDKDMDVSYFSRYTKVEDVRSELINIVETLMDLGEELYFIRSDYTAVKNYFRWKVDARDRIDIMPTWTQGGMVFRPTFVGYSATTDIIQPLKKEIFYGHEVWIPNNPEHKLSNVYGEDWRIPNPAFKKGTRKNSYTDKYVSRALCYGEEKQWYLIKRTKQWKLLSGMEKYFIALQKSRQNRILALIIPDKNWFKNNFFRWIRKVTSSKKPS